MEETQNNTSISACPTTDWIISCSLSDEMIKEYGSSILNKPFFWMNPQDATKQDIPIYSQEQMIEMFRQGFMTMSRTDIGQKILKLKKQKWLRPYTLLRKMDVGRTITFPYDKWSSVRTAASRIKKQFGSVYQTRKISPMREQGDIEVTRIS